MTYEESLMECAWCGSEHIETVVGHDPHQLALCWDCNNRYRKREPENSASALGCYFRQVSSVQFTATELADALREDLLYQLAWSKLYMQYARELDGVDFRNLVKQVCKGILYHLAGKLETGVGLTIPICLPSQEKAHDTAESSTCLVHNNGGT